MAKAVDPSENGVLYCSDVRNAVTLLFGRGTKIPSEHLSVTVKTGYKFGSDLNYSCSCILSQKPIGQVLMFLRVVTCWHP